MTLSVEDYFSVGDFLQVFPTGADSDCHAPAGELTFGFPCRKLHSSESQHLLIFSRMKFFSWYKIPNPSHKNPHRSFPRELYGRIFHFHVCLHFVLLDCFARCVRLNGGTGRARTCDRLIMSQQLLTDCATVPCVYVQQKYCTYTTAYLPCKQIDCPQEHIRTDHRQCCIHKAVSADNAYSEH